jgi:tetratricopeptide (TPR) repeat protein
LLHLGQIALIKSSYDDALNYFEAVTGSNYKSVEAHFIKGFIFWKKGDSTKALQEFRDAVKYSQSEKPIKGVLGEGDTKLGSSLKRSNRLTLFTSHLYNLSAFDIQNVLEELENRYQKLDDFLEQIRRAIQS